MIVKLASYDYITQDQFLELLADDFIAFLLDMVLFETIVKIFTFVILFLPGFESEKGLSLKHFEFYRGFYYFEGCECDYLM
jgi:hypothetical protein